MKQLLFVLALLGLVSSSAFANEESSGVNVVIPMDETVFASTINSLGGTVVKFATSWCSHSQVRSLF